MGRHTADRTDAPVGYPTANKAPWSCRELCALADFAGIRRADERTRTAFLLITRRLGECTWIRYSSRTRVNKPILPFAHACEPSCSCPHWCTIGVLNLRVVLLITSVRLHVAGGCIGLQNPHI